MKYAVIAALLATCNAAAAPTGCKVGLKAKVFSDSKCKNAATSEHNFLEKDVAKTGKCQTHEASTNDLKAVQVSEKLLEASKTAAHEANKSFVRTKELDVQIGDPSNPDKFQKNPAPEVYKNYPAIKQASCEATKYRMAYREYLQSHATQRADIEAYTTQYSEYYVLTQEKKADQVPENIKAAKDDYEEAAKKLPKPEDAEIVINHVKTQYEWDHILTKEVGDGTNARFNNQERENRRRVGKYAYLDCENDIAKAALVAKENVVKQAAGKVDAHTFATLTTCDATAGVVVHTYDDADCTKDPESTFKSKWNGCEKWGDEWVKVTGAAALKAAAVAVVAFAGSQF